MQAQSKYANLGSLHSLAPEDVEKLKKSIKSNEIFQKMFLVLSIIGVGALFFIFFRLNVDLGKPYLNFGVIAVVVFFDALIQYIFRKAHERKTADLNQGMKFVIEGPLEKKVASSNGKTTTYYFVIKGERFTVQHNLYKQFSEGNPMEVQVTPNAGYVLYIGAKK